MRLQLLLIPNNGFYDTINSVLSYLGVEKAIKIYEVSDCVAHRVFLVKTMKGTYSVKQLSSAMLKKENELSYHVASQKIAKMASGAGIPALYALQDLHGNSVISLDGFYYLIHRWVNYNRCERTTYSLVFSIGRELALLHKADIKIQHGAVRRESYEYVDWSRLNLLKAPSTLKEIEIIEEKCMDAFFSLSKNERISHRDMTPNNVLINNNEDIIIIDWDAAGYINVEKDILQTLRSWCINEESYNRDLVIAFLNGYLSIINNFKFKEFDNAYLSVLCEDFEWIQDCIDKEKPKETIIASLTDIVLIYDQLNIVKEVANSINMI